MPTASREAAALKTLISQKRIERTVRSLARRIDRYARTNGIRELSVLCVLDGAFLFCADLVRCLRTPVVIAFVKARSYNGARRGALTLTRLPKAIQGRPVLIVDTVYDTGMTIQKVLREVRKQTSRIALAILVEKHGKAALPPHSWAVETFVGIRVRGDPFLVGYGLDCGGRFRQLKDICVKQEVRSQ